MTRQLSMSAHDHVAVREWVGVVGGIQVARSAPTTPNWPYSQTIRRVEMSIRSTTSLVSSFATIVWPSGERKASSAVKLRPWQAAVHREAPSRPAALTMRTARCRSAIRRSPAKGPPRIDRATGWGDSVTAGVDGPGMAGPVAFDVGAAPVAAAARPGVPVGLGVPEPEVRCTPAATLATSAIATRTTTVVVRRRDWVGVRTRLAMWRPSVDRGLLRMFTPAAAVTGSAARSRGHRVDPTGAACSRLTPEADHHSSQRGSSGYRPDHPPMDRGECMQGWACCDETLPIALSAPNRAVAPVAGRRSTGMGYGGDGTVSGRLQVKLHPGAAVEQMGSRGIIRGADQAIRLLMDQRLGLVGR